MHVGVGRTRNSDPVSDPYMEPESLERPRTVKPEGREARETSTDSGRSDGVGRRHRACVPAPSEAFERSRCQCASHVALPQSVGAKEV